MNCNSGSNGNTGSSSDNVLSGGGGGGAVIAPGVSSVVENSQQVQLVQPPTSAVSLPTALAGFTPQQLTLMQQMMALQQVGMLPQMMGLLGMPSPLVAAGVSGGGVVLGNGDNTNNNSSNNNNNVGEGEDGGTVTAATKLEQ